MATEQDHDKNLKLINSLIGAKAELTFSTGLYKGKYASRLEDIEPAKEGEAPLLGMAHPMFKGALLPVSRSLELSLRLEGNACFYQSPAEIVRTVLNVPIPLVWLRLDAPLERVQRRMFVRVPCGIKARAYLLEVNSEYEAAEAERRGAPLPTPQQAWFPLLLNDISLGGVGALIQKEQADMCRLKARYLLQMAVSGTEFFVVCDVVTALKDETGRLSAGLSYEGLPAFTEKLMGAFIRQQELNGRGS